MEDCTIDCYRNVFAIWPNDDVMAVLAVADVVVPVLASPLIVWRLWRHWRDASWIGRQAILPVLVAVSIVIGSVSLQYLGDRLDIEPVNAFYMSALQPIPLFILPIGLLIGVLRLRLNRGRVADLVMELGRGVPLAACAMSSPGRSVIQASNWRSRRHLARASSTPVGDRSNCRRTTTRAP